MAEGIALTSSESSGRVGRERAELAGRFARGEPGSFAEVVALHHQRVSRLVYRLLGWSDDAGDVVQDVFVSAFSKARQLRAGGSLSAWLTKIAVNTCRSHWRKQVVRLRFLGHAGWQAGNSLDCRPEAEAVRDETFRQVRRAVQALPRRLGEVVVLRYLEEMSVAETAAALGISPEAVNVRLHRARGRLKELLADLVEE